MGSYEFRETKEAIEAMRTRNDIKDFDAAARAAVEMAELVQDHVLMLNMKEFPEEQAKQWTKDDPDYQAAQRVIETYGGKGCQA